jgi:hypothetical protein
MRLLRLPIALAALLAGCATAPSVPEGYSGPRATLQDTGTYEDGSKAIVFIALEIDGRSIQNTVRASQSASYGKGFALTLRHISRDIPARPLTVKLRGTHVTAAPIHEIASRVAGTFFSVEGDVSFSPEDGKLYYVTGELTKAKSCVWIEDRATNAAVVNKVCTK